MAPTRSRAEVEPDIPETFGLVSSFVSRIPDQFLAPEWELMKNFESGEKRIPNKYKELIGVGADSETKCRYCTLFHQEAAKLERLPQRDPRGVGHGRASLARVSALAGATGFTRPSRMPSIAISTRLPTPSLSLMCATCTLAVYLLDEQLSRDFTIGSAVGDQDEDLEFAWA